MRLGFVGVGKHARRLRDAFAECGAEIVAYDRQQGFASSFAENMARAHPEGFGVRMAWADMATSVDIDAIVCCAPPDVTAEVALAAANAGKRVCATKPLRWPTAEGADEARGVWVDLWRLYSPAWLALKADLQGKEIRSVHVDFYGNGPVRSTHSGLLDYGPHALAFVLDLGLRPDLFWREVEPGQWLGATLGEALPGRPQVVVQTGSGFDRPRMVVKVETTDGREYIWHERDQVQTYEARGSVMLLNTRDLALRNFCRAFLAREPSDTLRISCEAMRLLRQAEPTPARPAAP